MMEEQNLDGGIGTRLKSRKKMEEQEHDGGVGRRWRNRNYVKELERDGGEKEDGGIGT